MRPAPVRMSILAILLGASPLLAGPPWISIEYPANPYDRTTQGALLTLHTYHHGVPLEATVTARAEGIVGGVRRTIQLSVRPTGRPGVVAVAGRLPAGTSWVVISTMGDPETSARASAMLVLDAEGQPMAVTVPTVHRGEWITPREATAADIDALLKGARSVADAPSARLPDGTGLASISALTAFGLIATMRRRRPGRKERH